MQDERRRLERRQLNEAAEILMRHQRKGLPWSQPVLTMASFFQNTKSSATHDS